MRKLLLVAMLLGIAVFAFAACNRNDDGDDGGTGQGTGAPGEVVVPMSPVGDREYILARVAQLPAPTGYIINAHATRPDTNILSPAWSNPQPNAHARILMFNGLETMSRNIANEFFPNPMVMVGGNWPQIIDNADGSRTFRFTIYTGNQFSDGTFITARHYAGGVALAISHQWASLVPSAFDLLELAYRTPFIEGLITELPSVRIYSDSEFSVTYAAEFVPNVWEAQMHMNHGPTPLHMYGVEAHDAGNGVFLTAIGGGEFTLEALRQTVHGGTAGFETDEDGNYRLAADGERIPYGDGIKYRPTVFSGPYMFESLDVGNGVLTLVANPYFPGTWDGLRPRIERVIWRMTPSALMVDAVATGVAHVMIGIEDGGALENAIDILVSNGEHTFVTYDQFGQLFTQFHVDTGPTQFREVRQAISFLLDRHEMNEFVGRGFSVVAHGPWAPAWWWYQEAANRDLYDRITIYDFNMDRAIELLEQGGWNYNADGTPFVGPGDGVNNIRHKWVDEWVWGTDADGNVVRLARDAEGNLLGDNRVYTGNRVLMPLVINWMVRTVDYRFRDAMEVQLPDNLAYAGGRLVQERNDGWSAYLSGGYRQANRFEMHTLGIGMGNPWTPWMNVGLEGIPAQNWHQVDCQVTRDMADRFRVLNLATPEGHNAFIETFIDYMAHLTYEAFTLPFNMAVSHDFIPPNLGNWANSGVWAFPMAVQRAYWR
jgi:ABC-type transport system substrate-binding protein